MNENEIIFEASGICKSFGPTKANSDVSLTLRRGEVHALAGENGSGKSTLISIICGLRKADSGEMKVKGVEYNPASPLDANKNKIGFVVQELGVINNLPVACNLFLGNMEKYKKGPFVDVKKMFTDAQALLESHGVHIPVWVKAGRLPVEKRKQIEITKAMSIQPDILILDETTQVLSMDTRRDLYSIIEQEKKKGTAILFVTHDVEEMCALSDCVTVLRDGAVVCDLEGDDITVDNIRTKMVGRKVEGNYYRTDFTPTALGDVALEVRNLSHGNAFKDISFDVHFGEIVALCGLSDAGIHEVGKTLTGILKADSGTVYLPKRNATVKKPTDAMRRGMAYVPKDRDSEALMMGTTIYFNLILPSIRAMTNKLGFIWPSKLRKLADKAATGFSVRCLGIDQAIGALSGGNKQKVSIGRWLIKDLDVLVMDCPTRGVDVSVKAYIYNLMKELKSKGMAMVLICDEMTEAIGMADHLIVLKDGKLSAEIDRSKDLDERKVIEVMI